MRIIIRTSARSCSGLRMHLYRCKEEGAELGWLEVPGTGVSSVSQIYSNITIQIDGRMYV